MRISLTTVPASVAGAPPTHARRAVAARWPARLARVDDDVVPYEAAMTRMGEMARERRTGLASDRLWLLSHPQLYTVGRRTDPADLPDPRFGIPVVRTSRGGQLTYHAPGQLVGYVVADIGGTVNVVPFLHLLEDRLVQAVERLGVPAERRPTPPGSALLTGVWTRATGRKLVSIGLRASRGITTHGFSLNVDCDMRPWSLATPCGMPQVEMTSLDRELSERGHRTPTMADVRDVVSQALEAA